jgi:hypothetical protein
MIMKMKMDKDNDEDGQRWTITEKEALVLP